MKYCRKEDDVFYHMVITKTNTKTKTKTETKTKTKCIEDTTYAIFSKSREFKDIKFHHFITSSLHPRPDQDRTDQRRPEKTSISRT